MAKPAPIIVGDTFLDWRTRYNILLDMVPEVVESATLAPTAADDTYEVGTIWVKLDSDLVWMLVHTTGAADSLWSALGTGLANIVEDVTPQLGGPLDINGQDRIWDSVNGNIYIGDGFAYNGDTSYVDITAYQPGTANATVGIYADNTVSGGHIVLSSSYVYSNTMYGQIYNPSAWSGDTRITAGGSVRVSAPILELLATESLIIGPNGSCDIRIQSAGISAQKPILLWAGGHLDIKSGVLTESTYNANFDINFRASRNINLDSPSGLVRANGLVVLTTDDLINLDADTLNGVNATYLLNRDNHTGSIDASDLATNAVETIKINDLAVTAAKIANDNVDNTKLANMGSYTIKLNNSGVVADPTDLKISQIDEDATPGSGDWVLGESAGVMKRFDVGNIGGGVNWKYTTVSGNILPNEGIVINSNGTARTITVPVGPLNVGDVYIVHHTNTSATQVLVTIADNGNNIQYKGVNYTNGVTIENGETIEMVAITTTTLQIV